MSRFRKIKKIYLLLFVLVFNICFSQKDSIVVKGIVYNEKNCEPMPFVVLKIDVNDCRYDVGTMTDFDGRFKIKIPKFIFNKKPLLLTKFVGYDFDTIFLNISNYKEEFIIYGRSNSIVYNDPEFLEEQIPIIDPEYGGGTVKREEYSKMQSLYPTQNTQSIHEYYNEKNKLFKTIKMNPNYIEGHGIVIIERFNSDSLPTEVEVYSDYRMDTAVYHYYEKISWDKKKRAIEKLTWSTNNDKTTWRQKFSKDDNLIYYEATKYDATTMIYSGFKTRYCFVNNEKKPYKTVIEYYNEIRSR